MPQHGSKRTPSKRRHRSTRHPIRRNPSIYGNRSIHNFRKIVVPSSITATSAAEGLYAFSFTLSSLSEAASFTSIFDQYRIKRVNVFLLPASQLATNVTSVPAYSHCFVVTDFDDDTALASSSLALNYQNCKVLFPGQSHRRSFAPRCNEFIDSGATTAARSIASPWLDCVTTTVKHYGLKIAVTQSTSTNQSYWILYLSIDFQFRMVR